MAKLANDPEMVRFWTNFLASARKMKAGVAG